MTNCPICHVKNHDEARFCAECGQRLNGQGPPLAPPPPNPPVQPPSPADSRGPQTPRLHSPLLSTGGMETVEGDATTNAAEINRLSQLTARGKEDPAINNQQTPYKNPFDPRHAQAQPPGQNQSAEAPRQKLRSPLLSGDDFDDEDQSQPQADPPASAGSGLRSPLLGGGGSQSGSKKGAPQGDPNFAGQVQERKHHLHSPLLHNAESYNYDESEPELDEAIDEDDPNVLRSPLLAAKRPLTDRPAVNSPSGSNTQMPTRPPQSPDAMQFGANKPAPTSAYTSLRSMDGSALPTDVSPTPHAPYPAQPAPLNPAAPFNTSSGSTSSGSTASAAAPPDQYQFGMNHIPQTVPAAFQNLQSGQIPASASPAVPAAPEVPKVPTQAAAVVDTTGNINPEAPARPFRPGPATPPPFVQEPQRKPSSRLLSGAYDDTDEQHYAAQTHERFAAPPSPPSPLPKLIGGIAVLLLMGKLYVIATFFQTQWRDSLFLVVDQFIGMALIICLIVLAFSQKNR